MLFQYRGRRAPTKGIDVAGVHTERGHLRGEPSSKHLRRYLHTGFFREITKRLVHRRLADLKDSFVVGVTMGFERLESGFVLLVVEWCSRFLDLGLLVGHEHPHLLVDVLHDEL